MVSIGGLGFFVKQEKVLRELNKRLKPKGRVYFVDYDHMFKIISTRRWLQSNETIKKFFSKCGFKVEVEREKNAFWETIHIYGYKSSN